ncbi:MAG: hypothetical protein ACFFAJ_14695 [Candidatus Hodarchaeota archaeon]
MAWIGGVIAAATAADNTGKRSKKPNKLVLLFTIVALLMGTFIPLGLFIMNPNRGNFFPIFMLIVSLMVVVGTLPLALAFTESEHLEVEDDYCRESRPRRDYIQEPKSRRANNWENLSPESYYWGTEPLKSTKQYCTNCGVLLEGNDIFCFSCGRRVN